MYSGQELFHYHQQLCYCLAGQCICSTSNGTSVEAAVADVVADVETTVADTVSDDVAIAAPTLFNLIDAPCCNNYNALG